MENLEELQSKLVRSISKCSSINELEELRISSLGKKGKITNLMRELSEFDVTTRKSAGKALNLLKMKVVDSIDEKKRALQKKKGIHRSKHVHDLCKTVKRCGEKTAMTTKVC